jgi:hypothetical protein
MYYVASEMLVDDLPVTQDWKTRHVDYTFSEGIHVMDKKGNQVEEMFPQQRFYYGPDFGFYNWAISKDAEAGGVVVTGPESMLFDYSLPQYLPSKLMRYRDTETRLKVIFPFLEQGEEHLVSDGKDTFWAISLIAELPTNWVPNSRTKLFSEVGLATINVRSGEIKIYQVDGGVLSDLLDISYGFEQMPQWLKEQMVYSERLFQKQLRVLDYYFAGTLAKLRPDYLMFHDGPALVLSAKNVGDQKVKGYLYMGSGKNYGVQKFFKYEDDILSKEELDDMLKTSGTKVSEGVDLGPYVSAGRAKIGDPIFYPVNNRVFYLTPLYIKEDSTNIVRHVIVTDAHSGNMGVGDDAKKAFENFFGV